MSLEEKKDLDMWKSNCPAFYSHHHDICWRGGAIRRPPCPLNGGLFLLSRHLSSISSPRGAGRACTTFSISFCRSCVQLSTFAWLCLKFLQRWMERVAEAQPALLSLQLTWARPRTEVTGWVYTPSRCQVAPLWKHWWMDRLVPRSAWVSGSALLGLVVHHMMRSSYRPVLSLVFRLQDCCALRVSVNSVKLCLHVTSLSIFWSLYPYRCHTIGVL